MMSSFSSSEKLVTTLGAALLLAAGSSVSSASGSPMTAFAATSSSGGSCGCSCSSAGGDGARWAFVRLDFLGGIATVDCVGPLLYLGARVQMNRRRRLLYRSRPTPSQTVLTLADLNGT